MRQHITSLGTYRLLGRSGLRASPLALDTVAICPMRRAVRLWLVFPVPADVPDMSESHDHPAAVFASRRFAPAPRSQAARSSRVRLP
jgi:hypothetical protein